MRYTEKEVRDLWDKYYPKVYGYFYNRINNTQDIEDLTSITLGVFFDKINNVEIKNPHAYLWRIAYNQLLVFIRQKSKKPVSIDPNEAENFIDDSKYSDQKIYLYNKIIEISK